MDSAQQSTSIRFVKSVLSHPLASFLCARAPNSGGLTAILQRAESGEYSSPQQLFDEMEQCISAAAAAHSADAAWTRAAGEVRRIIARELRAHRLSGNGAAQSPAEWGRTVAALRDRLSDAFSQQTDKMKQLSHIMPIERKPDIEFLDSQDYKQLEKLLREESVTRREFVDIVSSVQPELWDLEGTNELNLLELKPAAVKALQRALSNRGRE